MKKYYIVQQPPLAEKYTFLVDDVSEVVNYGLATDMDKINYNRKIMGESFNIDIKVGLLMAESKGATFVFDLGRFVTVLELRADEKEGEMAFYDYDVNATREELNKILVERYSQNIANEWFRIQKELLEDFIPEDDVVRLHKPDF